MNNVNSLLDLSIIARTDEDSYYRTVMIPVLRSFVRAPGKFDMERFEAWTHEVNTRFSGWRRSIPVLEFESTPRRQYVLQLVFTEDVEGLREYRRDPKSAKLTRSSTRPYALVKLRIKVLLKKLVKRSDSGSSQGECVFLFPELTLGGAERALVHLANFLADEGIQVDILLLKKKPRNLYAGQISGKVKFVSLSEAKGKSYRTAVNYAQWVAPHYMLKLIRAERYIQYVHTDLCSSFDLFPRDRYKNALRKIDLFVCVSKAAEGSLHALYPFSRGKTKVVYNPYDFSKLKELGERTSGVSLADDTVNIVSVGRLHRAKGFLRAQKVACRLKGQGLKFRWYVIGDGEERGILEDRIKRDKLEDTFILLGASDNPFPILKKADIAALVSHYEGYGLSILEAKMFNLPIIATDFPAAREIITDCIEGIIVPNSEQGIEEGLKRLISDGDLRKKLSENRPAVDFDYSAAVRGIYA